MLNQETKRKIDSARDILVGKVPDPKAQVEQITTAMIYKFMDDMDKESMELGGKARFFTNGFEKYSWSKLMDPKLGGQERLETYGEAVMKMSQNPHIPQLFRDVFKDAFLPYRNSETLNLFLKEINGFNYEHSEDLGDAFEYLLSILGSQGDAGQFRTPRHIIDFIVSILDPKKDETILDPACGTAGFLISAYKHILSQHKDKPLNPDEKERMMKSFVGYDISPDMVKLSKVNMYLHGFQDPKIQEYDTLTSEEHWDEMFDVILANPPFMTPKGGIRPHKRFSVQANRSEVLFVDYIKEHLRPTGRAGIIVPEGIIFQSAGAYKQLRKILVEDGLVAVISLPSGVFQPYSGVKTSILYFDNSIAKLTDKMLFIKVANDGFDLGAQRREIKGGELGIAQSIIYTYRALVLAGKFNETTNWTDVDKSFYRLVSKKKIANEGDYNLSSDEYIEDRIKKNQSLPEVELNEVCDFVGGYAFKSELLKKSKDEEVDLPVIKIGSITKDGRADLSNVQYGQYEDGLKKFLIKKDDILIAMTGATVGKVGVSDFDNLLLNQRVGLIRATNKVSQNYLKVFLLSEGFYNYCQQKAGGGAQGNISPKQILSFKIPLPPLEIQNIFIAEIENKQSIISNAKDLIKKVEREREQILDKFLKG